MRTILPHISIGHDEYGNVQVSIEDYELFDCVSDFLCEECDVEIDSLTETTNSQGEVHSIFFEKHYTMAVIEKHLKKLKPKYIEEIYAINNQTHNN